MSSIGSTLEKGKAPYQEPQLLNLPENLISLIIENMDVSTLQNMACTSKSWRALILGEVKYHLEQRAMGFIDFVEERANQEDAKLESQFNAIMQENVKIGDLLAMIEEKKGILQKPGELDAWLFGVYRDLREAGVSNLSGKIREWIVSLEQDDKGPAKILTSLTDLLKRRNEENLAQSSQIRDDWGSIKGAISHISNAKRMLESAYGGEQNLFSDKKISSNVEDQMINSLYSALTQLPASFRNSMSYDNYASRFIRELRAHLRPEVVSHVERGLNLARDSGKTPLAVLSEMREPHHLDHLLVRSEIRQFNEIDNFESEKNGWVNRLILAAENEELRKELGELLNNKAIQNSETLLEAIESRPTLVTFLAGYVLKKIETEIRENAFLDIPSIPMGVLNPMDYEGVNAISTRTIERCSRLGNRDSRLWKMIDMEPVIENLFAYNLVYRAEELARPGSSRSQEVLLALVKHYEPSDVQKSRRYYLDYLIGLKGQVETKQLKEALQLGLSLDDMSGVVVKIREAAKADVKNEKLQETLLHIFGLQIEQQNIVEAKELLPYLEDKRKAKALRQLGQHERKNGNLDSSRDYFFTAFQLASRKDKREYASELDCETLPADLVARFEELSPYNKIYIHITLAKNAQEKGLDELATAQLNSAIKQIHRVMSMTEGVADFVDEYPHFVGEIAARLKKSGQNQRADKWVQKIQSTQAPTEIAEVNDCLLKSLIELKMADEVIALAPSVPNSQYFLGKFALELLATDIEKAFEVGAVHNAIVYIQSEFASLRTMAPIMKYSRGEWDAKSIFNIGFELEKRGLFRGGDQMTMSVALLFMIQQSSFEESLELLKQIPDKYREEAKQIIALFHWQTPDLQERLGTLGDIASIKKLIAHCQFQEVPGLIRQLDPIYHSECAKYVIKWIDMFGIPRMSKESLQFVLEIYKMIQKPSDEAKNVETVIRARLEKLSLKQS